jgi:hypothetical protein
MGVIGVALAVAAPAGADPPTREPVTQTAVVVATDICAFPITVTAHQTGFAITGADGTSANYHLTEQDTFTANGHTLTSERFTFDVHFTLDSQGNVVHAYSTGQIVAVPLEQGVTFRAAGRFDFVAAGADFVLVPQSGGSHNQDAFCSALAG